MRNILFTPKAWKDLEWIIHNEAKSLKKLHILLEAIRREPFTGIGKPERLKGGLNNRMSRRLNHEDRIVYLVEDSLIKVISLKGHYE